jgi:hypothetical protein
MAYWVGWNLLVEETHLLNLAGYDDDHGHDGGGGGGGGGGHRDTAARALEDIRTATTNSSNSSKHNHGHNNDDDDNRHHQNAQNKVQRQDERENEEAEEDDDEEAAAEVAALEHREAAHRQRLRLLARVRSSANHTVMLEDPFMLQRLAELLRLAPEARAAAALHLTHNTDKGKSPDHDETVSWADLFSTDRHLAQRVWAMAQRCVLDVCVVSAAAHLRGRTPRRAPCAL